MSTPVVGSAVISVDPRTGHDVEVVAADHTDAEVDAICRGVAGTSDALDDLGRAGRAGLLRAVARELDDDAPALVAIADRETALGEPRLTGELARATYQLRYLADALDDGSYLEPLVDPAADTPLGPRPDLRRMLVPIGPVAVFGASNFPFAFSVAGGDTAAALAAGCPVVIKAHPGHPATSVRSFAALRRALAAHPSVADAAGLVFGLDAGRALVRHPVIRAVGFTGSLAGGRALYELAAGRPDPIPFYGELAGVNPFIVTPAAAAARAGEIGRGVVDSVTLGTGQFCTKPGLLFVPADGNGDRLLTVAAEAIRTRAAGHLLTATTQRNYREAVDELSALPGVRLAAAGRPAGAGFSAAPALLTVDIRDLRADLVHECFGPVAVVVRYRDAAELTQALGTLSGALTATVHAEESDAEVLASLTAVLRRLAGRLIYNGYPTGVTVADAMTHGGPWPATTNSLHGSVGVTAMRRFLRPVSWQNAPQSVLPAELRDRP